MSILPSKKITPILVASLIAGGGIAFAATYKSQTSQSNTHLIVENQQPVAPTNDTTWQKTLSVLKPTTFVQSTTTVSASSTPESLNATQQMARDLLSLYMNAKQGGAQLTADQENALAQQVISDSQNAYIPTTAAKVYFRSDITVSNDDSDAAVKAYGEATAEAILNNVPKNNTDTELTILNSVANDNNPDAIQKLGPIVDSYKATLASLLKVKTPPSAVDLQLNLINDFSSVINIDERFQNYLTNPADSVYALKEYETTSVNVVNDFQAFALYLKNRNLTYTPDQRAYQFITGVGI